MAISSDAERTAMRSLRGVEGFHKLAAIKSAAKESKPC